jgi:hypothetical protein
MCCNTCPQSAATISFQPASVNLESRAKRTQYKHAPVQKGWQVIRMLSAYSATPFKGATARKSGLLLSKRGDPPFLALDASSSQSPTKRVKRIFTIVEISGDEGAETKAANRPQTAHTIFDDFRVGKHLAHLQARKVLSDVSIRIVRP